MLQLLLCLPAAAQEETAPDEEPPQPARQNLILREYFLRQYLESKRPLPLSPGRSRSRETPPDPFVERFIDRRIDHFIEELQESMAKIDEEVESVRQAGAALAESRPSVRQARTRLKARLDPLADHLGNLHKTLSIILVELKSKADFDARIDSSGENAGFGKEIEYIARQYEQAAQEIRDYFFKPSFTVSVHQMQGENMLIRLQWAQKMTKELRKSL